MSECCLELCTLEHLHGVHIRYVTAVNPVSCIIHRVCWFADSRIIFLLLFHFFVVCLSFRIKIGETIIPNVDCIITSSTDSCIKEFYCNSLLYETLPCHYP